MKNISLSISFATVLIISCHTLIGQTGPGGVGNSATAPFWLDAHTMGGTDGASISSWTDFMNGANAAQGTIVRQPNYAMGVLNGRNGIFFDGTDNMIAPAIASLNSATMVDMYVVCDIDNMGILSIPFCVDYGSTTAMNIHSGVLTQTGVTRAFGHNSISQLQTATFGATSGLTVYEARNDMTGNTIQAHSDFSLDASNGLNTLNSAVHEGFYISGNNTTYAMQGTIGEIFVFNMNLSACQEIIVQNYISAKYATPIAVADLYAFETTYGLGLIGIGRETAGDSHTDSQGNGAIRLNSPSGLGDGEYLFAGHDDVDLSELSLAVPDALVDASRLTRVWQTDMTGDVGTVTVTFDLDPLTDFSGDPANYRLLIDSDADFTGVIDQILSGTYDGGTNSITFTGVDFADGDFVTLAGDTPADIISVQDGPWSDPNTWDCSCVPSAVNNVTIDSDHSVNIDVDALCNSLTIGVDGELVMAADFDFSIYGDVLISGNLTLTDGSITFDGASDQFIDGDGQAVPLAFNDINLNSNDMVTFSNANEFVLNGKLSPNSGFMSVDFASAFVINSTSASGGGWVGEFGAGFEFDVLFTVRRFIDAGVADWRDLCSPVVNATFSDWDNELIISGEGFPDGCAYDTECFYSVRYWNGGDEFNVTNLASTIVNGRGYPTFLGDDMTTLSALTLDVTGELNTSADVVVSFPPGGGWQTVGNPYASPILFKDAIKSINIGNYFYVYDSATGGYQWYDGSGLGSSSIPELTDGLLSISQGFWVLASASGTLTFKQSTKTDNVPTYIRGASSDGETLLLTLVEHGSTFSSNVAFEENMYAVDDTDVFDVRGFSTGLERCPSILINSSDLLRKNHIANDGHEKAFDLVTNFKNAGDYTIYGSNFENFRNYKKILLVDHLTGEAVNLKEMDYFFHSDTGEFVNRFQIIFTDSQAETGSVAISTSDDSDHLEITQMGHMINVEPSQGSEIDPSSPVTISVFNLLGQKTVYDVTTQLVNGSNIVHLPESLKGVHIVTIQDGEKIVTRKMVF